jgi:hypothetical protein
VRRIKAEAIKASRDAQEKARQAALEKRILEEDKKRAARKQQGGGSKEAGTGAGGRPWTAGSSASGPRRNDLGTRMVGDEGEGDWSDAIDALRQDEGSMRQADSVGGSPSKNASPMPSGISSPGGTPSRRKRGTGRMSVEEKEAMEGRWGVGGVDEKEDTGHDGRGNAVEERRVDGEGDEAQEGEEKDDKDEVYSLLAKGGGEGEQVVGPHGVIPVHVPLERGWSDDEHSQVGPHPKP